MSKDDRPDASRSVGQLVCAATGSMYDRGSFSDLVHRYIAASTADETDAIKEIFAKPQWLLKWTEGLTTELTGHMAFELGSRGFEETLRRFQPKWLTLGASLLESGFPMIASELFTRWYCVIRESEIAQRRRFPKGTELWQAARARLALGQEDARNWFLMAMLDDIRSDPSTWKALPAHDWLVNATQASAASVDALGVEAQRMYAEGTWAPAEPESTWLALRPHRRRLTRGPLPFLKALAEHLMQDLATTSRTAKQAGDSLETVVAYLFATVPGFELVGPTSAPDAQNDLLVRNGHQDAALQGIGEYLLVECKHWKRKVKAPLVREFAGRLQACAVKTGVLVSSSGISGTKPRSMRSGARLTISKEYLRDRTAILILDMQSLQSIAAGDTTLVNELLDRFETVRFDRNV